MPKNNENLIIKDEHDSSLHMKKIALYGWDSVGGRAVMIKTDSNGQIYTSGGGGGVWGSITGTLSNQTDLATALGAKVPFTGATSDVNLTGYYYKGDGVKFSLLTDDPVSHTEGQMYWRSDTQRLTYWGTATGYAVASLTDVAAKVTKNSDITAGTKTKITYDVKGLVTAGADATTADIADSTDRRYCTDAQKTVIGNTSGTNTGDQNIFSTVVVSGQTTVTTASTSQALTLVAGTNVTLTTDNTAKSVTIAASGSGGSSSLLRSLLAFQ